jgi:hypothetical protein
MVLFTKSSNFVNINGSRIQIADYLLKELLTAFFHIMMDQILNHGGWDHLELAFHDMMFQDFEEDAGDVLVLVPSVNFIEQKIKLDHTDTCPDTHGSKLL